ncbi:MAG: transcriptional regulator [Alphaproteobacteria bacterium]|nr:transcriptional regulator [Alphaproteobacteria bacterium]
MEIDHHSKYKSLFEVISLIETAKEAENFLLDLCTPAEIKAFIERWKVCQLLNERNFSYREIKDMTGASLTTISRVARFLNDEKNGGYKTMLEKSKEIVSSG